MAPLCAEDEFERIVQAVTVGIVSLVAETHFKMLQPKEFPQISSDGIEGLQTDEHVLL